MQVSGSMGARMARIASVFLSVVSGLVFGLAPGASATPHHAPAQRHHGHPRGATRPHAFRQFHTRQPRRAHLVKRHSPMPIGTRAGLALQAGANPFLKVFSSVANVQASVSPTNARAEAAVYKVRFKATSALSDETGIVHVALPAGAETVGCGEGTEVIDGIQSQYASFAECGAEIAVYAPFAIAKGDTVELLIRGVTNPPAKATVKVEVWTSADTTHVASPSFEITAPTAVTNVQGAVVPANAKAEQATYTIKFKATSALVAEVGRISALLPAGASLEGCGEGVEVVDGAKRERAFMRTCEDQELAVWTPYAIAAGDSVELVIQGVANPTAKTSSAKVEAWTTSDVIKASSPVFSIGEATSVTAVTASVSPTNAGAEAAVYKVKFKATTGLTEEVGRIHVVLPAEASQGGCGEGVEVIDGAKSSRAFLRECGHEVVVWTPFTIANGDNVEVVMRGVDNPPAKTTTAKVEVRTSADANPVSSPNFTIASPTSVSGLTVGVSPTNAGAETAVYKVKFKVANGLSAEVGRLHVLLPTGATTAEGCGEGVEVIDITKSETAAGYYYYYNCGQEVVVYAPYDIAAGDTVELLIKGALNPAAKTSTAKVEAWTSSDATKVASTNFTITDPTAVRGSARASARATRVRNTPSTK